MMIGSEQKEIFQNNSNSKLKCVDNFEAAEEGGASDARGATGEKECNVLQKTKDLRVIHNLLHPGVFLRYGLLDRVRNGPEED